MFQLTLFDGAGALISKFILNTDTTQIFVETIKSLRNKDFFTQIRNEPVRVVFCSKIMWTSYNGNNMMILLYCCLFDTYKPSFIGGSRGGGGDRHPLTAKITWAVLPLPPPPPWTKININRIPHWPEAGSAYSKFFGKRPTLIIITTL
jgi:hypothetical protein